MPKLPEKFFDVRTMEMYLKKGVLTRADIDQHAKALPNDESNFELTILEEDDKDVPSQSMSDDEIKSMPPLTEDDIDNFDFLEKKEEEK
jgi:hypothetical protein